MKRWDGSAGKTLKRSRRQMLVPKFTPTCARFWKQNSTVDPFDSYSILKPDDGAFSIPPKARAPVILAVAAAVGLILLAVALRPAS